MRTVRNEGSRQPATIELHDLDEDAILSYLASIESNLPRYQIARNNCSHIIAKALIEGARRKPSFTPNAGHYGAMARVLGIGIWTPDHVLRFAMELSSS